MRDLFKPADIPFNLAGEQIDNGLTEEGEKRVRALAESEARKAQSEFRFVVQNGRRRYFNTQGAAAEYCSKVFARSGVVLGIFKKER
jgi:broad specificity phosphatase PhoE